MCLFTLHQVRRCCWPAVRWNLNTALCFASALCCSSGSKLFYSCFELSYCLFFYPVQQNSSCADILEQPQVPLKNSLRVCLSEQKQTWELSQLERCLPSGCLNFTSSDYWWNNSFNSFTSLSKDVYSKSPHPKDETFFIINI